MPDWHLYIVRCADHSLYTGITTNVARRFQQHQENKGAKRLKGRGPLKLVFQAQVSESKGDALRLEHAIKKLSRQDKLNLIKNHNLLTPLLEKIKASQESA